MSFDPQPYVLGPALLHFFIIFGVAMAAAAVVGLVLSVLIAGARGPVIAAQMAVSGLVDIVRISPRRVWALTMLTIREAIRRKALYVGIVFAILFMFAGWFLSGANPRPELQVKVYVQFVLTAITWLILPMILLLSCWGVPEDIKSRALHTVVTKPARRNEIVIGRMLGFTLVGTAVLAIMGVVGGFWIIRQLPRDVRAERLVCRVPVYGSLQFLNREGVQQSQGINVGNEWTFRGYIDGATRARAIYQFEGVTPERIGDKLVLDANFEAFRSHKGDMKRGLLYKYELVNPVTGVRVPLPSHELSEFGDNVVEAPIEGTYIDNVDSRSKTYNLFKDLVVDTTDAQGQPLKNSLRIEVGCLDAGQYIGAARPDLFIKTPNNPFWWGYFKSLLGIWLMMTLVVALGVSTSCFVKGPVATLLVFTLLVIGRGFREFMNRIVSGDVLGGGPLESMVRIINHLNPTSALPDSVWNRAIVAVDNLLINGLWLVQHIVPNFGPYSEVSQYLPNGFDVNWSASLLPSLLVTIAYLIPCILLGHFSLKLRELEAK